MAFKALNNTTGPNRLVPTLLVFSAYPQMTELDAPSPTVTQRANAVKKAIAEIRKLRAERQVADALNMRNRPKTNAVYNLPLNSPVLV
jgi:valyl-tRNA synthetase